MPFGSDIAEMVWQTDDCVYDDHNWGYVPGVAIKPTNTIVDELVDIVSKNGQLLLNISPMANGTIVTRRRTAIRFTFGRRRLPTENCSTP